jgi:hypothetical protein
MDFLNNKILHIIIESLMTILLSAALGSTFISLLYFTFGSYIEKLMVIKNIKYILDSFCLLEDTNVKSYLNSVVKNLQPLPPGPADQLVIDVQKKIESQAFYFYGKILLGVIVTITVLSYTFGISLFNVILKSVILLFGIAIVEVLFLVLVTYNYISALPNRTFSQLLNMPQLQVNLNDNNTKEPSLVGQSDLFKELVTKISNINTTMLF